MHNQSVTIMQDQVKNRVYEIMSSRPRRPDEAPGRNLRSSLWFSSSLLGIYILMVSTVTPI